MIKKAVVIYSGGMDSFTLLNQLQQQHYELYALSFDYNQRHKKELIVAKNVTKKLDIPHKIIDLAAINTLLAGSALTDDIPVPDGHYEEESMKLTIVPNRNMIFLALAIGYAVSLNIPAVYYGAHAGDHAIYPDCRPEFVDKMNAVSAVANYDKVMIKTPFLHASKGDILAAGLALGLNYANTWTCYKGREYACGRCGACQERLEAFTINRATDPLVYEK